MTYKIIVMPVAEREAQANRDWWAANRSVEQATRWYNEFAKSVLSLEQSPDRCALAPENDRFHHEVRQLKFGLGGKRTHRIVFTIRRNEVVILRDRHLSQAEIE
jgi:plasmid stabilization system protein ParE